MQEARIELRHLSRTLRLKLNIHKLHPLFVGQVTNAVTNATLIAPARTNGCYAIGAATRR